MFVATPYLRLVFGFESSEPRALSHSISFHVLCFPLLILSSILHIVDIAIDVFAAAVIAIVVATACYSNYERGTGRSERCSSIFIDKAEYLYCFSSLDFFFIHALPCLIFSLRHQKYTRTNSQKNAARKQTQCAKNTHTYTHAHSKRRIATKTNLIELEIIITIFKRCWCVYIRLSAGNSVQIYFMSVCSFIAHSDFFSLFSVLWRSLDCSIYLLVFFVSLSDVEWKA